MIYRAGNPEPGHISVGAWRAHLKNARLHEVDERHPDGTGVVSVIAYDLGGQRSWQFGILEFEFPDDAEAYERFTGAGS